LVFLGAGSVQFTIGIGSEASKGLLKEICNCNGQRTLETGHWTPEKERMGQWGTRRLWQRQKGTQKRHKYYGQAANELQEPNAKTGSRDGHHKVFYENLF